MTLEPPIFVIIRIRATGDHAGFACSRRDDPDGPFAHTDWLP
jgi:hypothetical protein